MHTFVLRSVCGSGLWVGDGVAIGWSADFCACGWLLYDCLALITACVMLRWFFDATSPMFVCADLLMALLPVIR